MAQTHGGCLPWAHAQAALPAPQACTLALSLSSAAPIIPSNFCCPLPKDPAHRWANGALKTQSILTVHGFNICKFTQSLKCFTPKSILRGLSWSFMDTCKVVTI